MSLVVLIATTTTSSSRTTSTSYSSPWVLEKSTFFSSPFFPKPHRCASPVSAGGRSWVHVLLRPSDLSKEALSTGVLARFGRLGSRGFLEGQVCLCGLLLGSQGCFFVFNITIFVYMSLQ